MSYNEDYDVRCHTFEMGTLQKMMEDCGETNITLPYNLTRCNIFTAYLIFCEELELDKIMMFLSIAEHLEHTVAIDRFKKMLTTLTDYFRNPIASLDIYEHSLHSLIKLFGYENINKQILCSEIADLLVHPKFRENNADKQSKQRCRLALLELDNSIKTEIIKFMQKHAIYIKRNDNYRKGFYILEAIHTETLSNILEVYCDEIGVQNEDISDIYKEKYISVYGEGTKVDWALTNLQEIYYIDSIIHEKKLLKRVYKKYKERINKACKLIEVLSDRAENGFNFIELRMKDNSNIPDRYKYGNYYMCVRKNPFTKFQIYIALDTNNDFDDKEKTYIQILYCESIQRKFGREGQFYHHNDNE